MKREDIKSLPNQLTFLRFLSIPVLWLFAFLQFKVAFVIVFAFAGLTDILDGYLARILKKESDFGAWFDSLADNIIAASLIFWIWLLLPELLEENVTFILVVFGLFLSSLLIGYIKYRKMIDYHLYTTKAANVFIYVFLLHALLFGIHTLFFYLTLLVIAVGLLEEIAMTLTHGKVESHKKSVFK